MFTVAKIKNLLNGQNGANRLSTAVKLINSLTATTQPQMYFPNKNDSRVKRKVSTDLYHFSDSELKEALSLQNLALNIIFKHLEKVTNHIIRTYVIPNHREPDDLKQEMVDVIIYEILPTWNPNAGALTTFSRIILQNRIQRLMHKGDLVHESDEITVVLRNKFVRYISDHDIDIERTYGHMEEICKALKTRPDKIRRLLVFEQYEYHSSLDSSEYDENSITKDVGNNTDADTTGGFGNFSNSLTNGLIFTELKSFAKDRFSKDEDLKKIGIKTATNIVALYLDNYDNGEIVYEVKAHTDLKQPKKVVDTVLYRWHEYFEKSFAIRCFEKDIIGKRA